MIANLGGSNCKSKDGTSDDSSGLGIVLGTVLGGIPESAVLGMSLPGGGGVSFALLAGIWVSNFPEGLASTVNLSKSGMSKGEIRLMWLAIVAVSALAAAVGLAIVNNSSTKTGALVEAFAAGALLTMIADEMDRRPTSEAASTPGWRPWPDSPSLSSSPASSRSGQSWR